MKDNIILVKDIIEEDCVNYKKIGMFVIFPNCSFKCDIENGNQICQNSNLVNFPNIKIDVKKLLNKYLKNPLSESIILGGLEPFENFDYVKNIVSVFREQTKDDIVIYTGFNPVEIKEELIWLSRYKNIVVKFGRFIPNCPTHLDEVLGVSLSSPNQYGAYITLDFVREVTNEDS